MLVGCWAVNTERHALPALHEDVASRARPSSQSLDRDPLAKPPLREALGRRGFFRWRDSRAPHDAVHTLIAGGYTVEVTIWFWVAFNLFVLGMLALDLGVFHRHSHKVSVLSLIHI